MTSDCFDAEVCFSSTQITSLSQHRCYIGSWVHVQGYGRDFPIFIRDMWHVFDMCTRNLTCCPGHVAFSGIAIKLNVKD